MTIDEVCKICKEDRISKFFKLEINKGDITKNDDGSFDFNCDLFFYNCDFEKIPFKINKVNGSFFIHNSRINTCENFPKDILGDFFIDRTPIKDIEKNLPVKKVNEINIFDNIKFENLDFLYDVDFKEIWIHDWDQCDSSYKKFVKDNIIDKKTFEEMKKNKVIISNKDIEELDEYIMEI